MPASPLSSIYGAMRDSDSAGGHAGAQVVPRRKPAHGGVPATPRGREVAFRGCEPSTRKIRICDLHNRYRFGKVPTSAGANHTHKKLTGPPPGRARLPQKDRGQTYKDPLRQFF